MSKRLHITEALSKHLFWDVDTSGSDENKHTQYIISQVLKFGLYSDWQIILKQYGLELIINSALHIRDLDRRTASFLSIISGVPKSKFPCYTTKQYFPKHWNFWRKFKQENCLNISGFMFLSFALSFCFFNLSILLKTRVVSRG